MSILQSRLQQKITKLAKTDKTMQLYAADRIGYIYVYNMETFDPEQTSLRGQLQYSLVINKQCKYK